MASPPTPMQTAIPYGSTTFATPLPAKAIVLTIIEPEPRLNELGFRTMINTHLQEKTWDLNDTIIVVTDKTRVCGYPLYLPVLVDVLLANGMQRDNLRFIIAYGTHARQSEEECLHSYGNIYNEFPFIHHDCQAQGLFLDYGLTGRGTPIRLRRDIAAAGCVITMGPICHHYFAGYGGGRKLIFPGCGERASIYANHGLYLHSEKNMLSLNCQPGVLTNNPLAEDLFEIEQIRPADIAIHGIMDSHGRLNDVIIGNDRQTFTAACAIHGKLCEVSTPPFATVIASCGGFPKDINFIQSHKAIHNASMFVEDGGTLIIYAECRDGVGSTTFLPWFEMQSFTEAFHQLSHGYQGNGGTALAMMSKTARINIILVTAMDNEICTLIGVGKWDHAKVCGYLETAPGPIAYIPNASLLVRKQG